MSGLKRLRQVNRGFDIVVNDYRQPLRQHDFNATNVTNANWCAVETRYEPITAHNNDLDLRSMHGMHLTSMAHAIQTADDSVLPARINELDLDDM